MNQQLYNIHTKSLLCIHVLSNIDIFSMADHVHMHNKFNTIEKNPPFDLMYYFFKSNDKSMRYSHVFNLASANFCLTLSTKWIHQSKIGLLMATALLNNIII